MADDKKKGGRGTGTDNPKPTPGYEPRHGDNSKADK